jgi:hypothetical protein
VLFIKSPSLSFTPYPLFQFYPQSCQGNFIKSQYSSTKCWNSAFNAQGSRVHNSMSCTGRSPVTIYVAAVGGGRRLGKRKEGMKLSLPPKLVGNLLVWVAASPGFYKISFPVTHLMPYYTKTGRSRPLIA